jgi:patatin-like phospholipase/acyl hydrolase
MKKYRILSLDGGGVKGAFTTEVLRLLSKEISFFDKIDFFVGTSTGGLIALCLCYGVPIDLLCQMYGDFSKIIFSPNPTFQEGVESKYRSDHLKSLLLNHVFANDPKLSALPKKVAVTSFNLDKEKGYGPFLFHNFDRSISDRYTISDAALATAAAPLYFPSYHGFLDGGVFASNPTLCGLTLALEKENLNLSQIEILSVGTTKNKIYLEQDLSWGEKMWGKEKKISDTCSYYPLFHLMSEGANEMIAHQSKVLLKEDFHRINVEIDKEVGIDSYASISYLIEKANELPTKHARLWSDSLKFLERFCS